MTCWRTATELRCNGWMPAGVTRKNSRQTAKGSDIARSNERNSALEKPQGGREESLTREGGRCYFAFVVRPVNALATASMAASFDPAMVRPSLTP